MSSFDLKPDVGLNDRQFRIEMEQCINTRRPNIQLPEIFSFEGSRDFSRRTC